MKHRLLILGTLGEFVQLVKKSKERGYYTIVCDGYPDGPARQYADVSYVIPVTDIDAVAELCQKEPLFRICSWNAWSKLQRKRDCPAI